MKAWNVLSGPALCAAAALAIGGCSSATKSEGIRSDKVDQESISPLVGAYQVHRWVFANGLKLLVVEDHSSPTFAYQTWFKVGSRDEKVKYTGLAHLFEHMMFKETKNHPDGEFERLMDQAGAEGNNAFTSRDYTAYVQELPSQRLELIAGIEADRMVNLIVNEKAFTTEREVVKNERRYRTDNNPDGRMFETLFETAFTKHSYRWPVIGYPEDLERMSAKDAEAFYRAHYAPNHATVVVVGDVDPNEVRKLIEKIYAPIPARNDEAAPEVPSEPEQKSPRRKSLRLNIQVEKLIMAYHIPDISHEDMPALSALQLLLTGGKSARLHRALVDTGIASGVWGGEMEDHDPSLFLFGASLQKGKKASLAESAILRELELLAKNPVSDGELARLKNRLEYGFYEGLSSNEEKANFLGRSETVAGHFLAALALEKKTLEVTPAQIQSVVKKYLKPSARTVVTGVPK